MTGSLSFTADKRQLAAGLAWAASGLPRRHSVPVLACMRLEVSAGRVTLAGFDYDLTARATVAATDTVSGVCLPRGRELVTAVKGLPGGKGATVTAEASGERLTLTAGGVTASVEIMPTEDYPQLPDMPAAAGVMAPDAFASAIKRVAPAACRDDTLPVLCTVHMVTGESEIRLTATDRYRAAFDVIPWTPANLADAGEYPWTLNVPTAAVMAFTKAASKAGKVTLHLGEARMLPDGERSVPATVGFSDGEHELITRTVDAQYPNMERFQHSLGEIQGSADVDAAAFTAAVKRAGTAVEQNMPVHLYVARDGITVTAYRDGQVSSREHVPGESETDAVHEGRKVSAWRVAYNPAYLASMVAAVTGTVRLSWSGLGKPVQVGEADTVAGFRAIVMPVRTHAA